MKWTNHQGSLFIEVLVSISIAAVATLSIGALVIDNTRMISSAERQTNATALAKESMEQVFAIKQDSWLAIGNLAEGYYLVQRNGDSFELIPDPSYPPGESIDNFYLRTVEIGKAYRNEEGKIAENGTEDPQARKIEVRVVWDERGVENDIELTSFVTNWKGEQ